MLDRRLLLVTGKGGTGRSTLAASLALRAAAAGRRVLAIAMDGGSGLAAHLHATHLGAEPHRVGPLSISRIDPASALDEYLRLRLHAPRLPGVSRPFAAVAEAVPGVRDTVMIGKVVHESVHGGWDLVVADTPPIGQVASLLRAPATVAGLVPTGAVRDQASWLRDHLTDPGHTGVVVVATPEELPVTEALTFLAESSGDAAVAAVVANKVLAPLAESPTGEPWSTVAAHHQALVNRQRPILQRLSAGIVLPHLLGQPTPGAVATALAGYWGTP